MATVATTTQTVLMTPNVPTISREMGTTNTGYLYTVVRTAATTLTVYRSTDDGGSWSSYAAFTDASLAEWGSLVLDRYGYGHLMYRVSTAGNLDALMYRRLNLANATWSAVFQATTSDANGGVAGSRWQGVDCTIFRTSTGLTYVPWVAGYGNSGGQEGVVVGCLSVKTDGTVTNVNTTAISGNRIFLKTLSGRIGPSIEVEHNGNGVSSGVGVGLNPNLWITWGRTSIYMAKFAWNGSGWNGVSTPITLRSTISAVDRVAGRWDGTRFLVAVPNPDDTTTVLVYQRNQANTSTTTLTTPVHTTGVVRHVAISYDNVTKDLRVFAVGTSTDVLYFTTYTRATATWSAWATVTATAVLNSGLDFSVRRGGTAGNSKYDVVTAHSGAPNTVVHTSQTISTAPNVSSMITAGKPYTNGGPADVTSALSLSWTFTDADAGQTQGSYALSRQIGAGALAYWNAGTSTWGASEVQNSSSTQGVTLASGWGVDADPAYQYKVKVWDSTGVPASGYSAALTLNPSTPVNPSLTTPAAGTPTITTSRLTAVWTSASQTAARLILTQTSPTSAVRYDTGVMAGYTDTSFTIPYVMATSTGWTVTLYTYNSEGLASAAQVRAFNVAYAPPPAALSTFTLSPTTGQIIVTPSVLAPVGSQPTIVSSKLYRRKALYFQRLANGDITSTSGWFGVNATVTLSAVQVREGTNSLRAVPDGVGSDPRVQTTSAAAIVDASLVGTTWYAGAWVRPDTANKPIVIGLVYYDSGGTEIGTVTQSFTTVVATAWHFVTVRGNAASYPTAARVGMRVGLTSTPAASDAFYVDSMMLRPSNSDTGTAIVNETGSLVPYGDWGAASSTPYEYRWIVAGANGTSATGPWTF